ncbi:DNA-binding protein [Tepidimonas fonticaldi]|uniref:DNA-binding protein n=1 Tax=Tepidimonas fonticaldi TaxID=1101373 RepID=A0A1A6DSZ6_9BURK|nr:addiction module antidote protein [Tepidimonas fonticaldi]OBS29978.1 DNA-binding protein [Tepidimonas fonticaldi]
MSRPDRPHDETLIALMRDDPAFAAELLSAALAEAQQPGGREALLTTLRCYAEAKGMSAIAQETGLSRESLYRALSARGNPTLKTLLAVLKALGLRLGVDRSEKSTAAA